MMGKAKSKSKKYHRHLTNQEIVQLLTAHLSRRRRSKTRKSKKRKGGKKKKESTQQLVVVPTADKDGTVGRIVQDLYGKGAGSLIQPTSIVPANYKFNSEPQVSNKPGPGQ